MPTRGILAVSLFVSLLPAFCCAESPAQDGALMEGKPVRKISISGCRTNTAVLLSKIALKQNQPWTRLKENQTRQTLYDMKVFKKIEITSTYDADDEAVDVDILAYDGWFFVPLPFYSSNKGGSSLSLTLIEGNFFRHAENVFVMGSISQDTNQVSLGGSLHDWFVYTTYKYTNILEHRYTDDGYNSQPFYTTHDQGTGPIGVASSYSKRAEGPTALLSRKLGASGFSLGAEYSSQRVSFYDGSIPAQADNGLHNAAGLKLTYKTGKDIGRANFAQSFGALFGMGLADLHERIKTLPRPVYGFLAEASAAEAGPALGSDYSYTLLTGRTMFQAELPQRHTLTLRAAGARGNSLPLSQQIATRSVMLGTYEREFRGDTVAGGGISFAYFLRRSARGILVGEPFAEYASAWEGAARSQCGVGLNLYYRFWRFPIPLGLSYTYSLKDMRGQFSAALGASFK